MKAFLFILILFAHESIQDEVNAEALLDRARALLDKKLLQETISGGMSPKFPTRKATPL